MKYFKLNTIQTILYLSSVICAMSGMLLGFANISNDGFKYSFIPLVPLFLSCLLKKSYSKGNIWIILTISFLFVWAVAITITYTGVGLPLQLFAFVGILMLYYISMNWNISSFCMRAFLIAGEIGAAVLIYLYRKEGWLRVGMGMTIGDFNSQHIGIWAFIFACVCLIAIDTFKKIYLKIFSFILLIYMCVIMIGTVTRTTIIAFAFVLLIWLFPIRSMLKNNYVQIFISAIPLIVMILFCLLNIFYGSLLNGRDEIWYRSLGYSLENPLFGLYNKYNMMYTHNIFVEHFLYYGYIVAGLFIFITHRAVHANICHIDKQISYDAFICFIGCMIVSAMENLVFSAYCGGVFIFACSFVIIMANSEKESVRPNIFSLIINFSIGLKKGRTE